jgi:phosphoglycolate phosphatase
LTPGNKPPSTDTVLLDLDGTLTDPYVGITRCIVHALEVQGLPVPVPEEQRGWIGPPLQVTFREYFARLGRGDVQLAIDSYRERFAATGMYENEVYDGIPEVLEQLAGNGSRLYLATVKPTVFAERIVEHFGLSGWLQRSYGSELDGTRIDKVELLQYMLDQEGLAAASCAMVGDRHNDMEAARYHGMRAIGALWGYGSREELVAAGAEELARTPADLVALL